MIEAMQPGEKIEFEPSQVASSTLAFYACQLSKKLGREYHYRTVKGTGIYRITREA